MDKRRVDALVAERLFGWHWVKDRRTGQRILVDSDTEWVETFDLGTRVDPLAGLPHFSTTWEGLGKVVERMWELGYAYEIGRNFHGSIYAGFDSIEDPRDNGHGTANTDPMAASLAALRTMWVNLEDLNRE